MLFFFFNDTATTEIYTLSLHDALPICFCRSGAGRKGAAAGGCASACAGAGGRGVNASASARGQAGSSAAGGRGGGVMVRGAAGAGAKRLFSAIVAAPRSKEGAAAAAFGSRRAFTRLINS